MSRGVYRPQPADLVAFDLIRERDPETAQRLEAALTFAALVALFQDHLTFREHDWEPDFNASRRHPLFTYALRAFTRPARLGSDVALHQATLLESSEERGVALDDGPQPQWEAWTPDAALAAFQRALFAPTPTCPYCLGTGSVSGTNSRGRTYLHECECKKKGASS